MHRPWLTSQGFCTDEQLHPTTQREPREATTATALGAVAIAAGVGASSGCVAES